MYIFGGFDSLEGPLSSMWSFDLSEVGPLPAHGNESPLHWHEIMCKGANKPGRWLIFVWRSVSGEVANHSSVVYKTKMYLFGGSQGLNTNEKLYSFDTLTHMWEVVKTKAADGSIENLPPALDEHSAVVHQN